MRTIVEMLCTIVASCARTCRQKLCALYRSTTTRVAPAVSTGMRALSTKFTWHAGIVVRSRSPGVIAACQSTNRPEKSRFAWVSTTPFGSAVEPDENRIATGSSAERATRSTSASGWRSRPSS